MNAAITATEATAPSTPNSAIARVPAELWLPALARKSSARTASNVIEGGTRSRANRRQINGLSLWDNQHPR
jgi:hypothetical protein